LKAPSLNKPLTKIRKQDRQCKCKSYIQVRPRNLCCRGQAISITYSECLSLALVIHHSKRLNRIKLSYVACLALPQLPTLSHKEIDFREKGFEYKICVLIFPTNFV